MEARNIFTFLPEWIALYGKSLEVKMKQYKNFPYYVDRLGNVYRKGKTSPLKVDVVKKGYHRVSLCVDGAVTRMLVHRLVAQLYADNPHNYPDVLHGDNNPSNNNYTNLRWGNHSQNMLQCHKDNRCSNIIASNRAKEVTNDRTADKFKKLLGNRLVTIEFGRRAYVTYICKDCGKQFRSRTDSNVFKRGGDCRGCCMRKDKDIV